MRWSVLGSGTGAGTWTWTWTWTWIVFGAFELIVATFCLSVAYPASSMREIWCTVCRRCMASSGAKKSRLLTAGNKGATQNGEDFSLSSSLFRRFPCDAPFTTAISTTLNQTQCLQKSSRNNPLPDLEGTFLLFMWIIRAQRCCFYRIGRLIE